MKQFLINEEQLNKTGEFIGKNGNWFETNALMQMLGSLPMAEVEQEKPIKTEVKNGNSK